MATDQQHPAKSARADLLPARGMRCRSLQPHDWKHRVGMARHQQADTLDAITIATRYQMTAVSRSEAIRRLVELGLKAKR